MRILIAHNDSNVKDKIKLGLMAEGFGVDITADGETALWYANDGNYSVIILDIILAKMNGFDVCQTIRDNNISTPILILTTKNTVTDEVDALETGADDFLRIPFSTPVLIARIRALLRRKHRKIVSTINFGLLSFNFQDRKCFFDRQEILLSKRERQVMELLILAEGEVVTKQTIINQVWGIEFDGNSNIVDVYIGYLRNKLHSFTDKNILQTIRGVGYRLIDEAG